MAKFYNVRVRWEIEAEYEIKANSEEEAEGLAHRFAARDYEDSFDPYFSETEVIDEWED